MIAAGAIAAATLLAACAPGAAAGGAGASAAPISTDVDSKASTLTIMVADSTANMQKFADGFMKEHPKVTITVRSDTFANLQTNAPRIMAGGDAPDLIYLPTLGKTVKDHLIRNLDGYAKTYGWDKFPARQLEGMRVEADGTTKGTGSLYGMGMGYTMTGLYYNTDLAKQAGITAPPATVADLEADLARAKAAGLVPLMTSAKDAGVFFVFQPLVQGIDGSKSMTDWIYDKPSATIKTDGAERAATMLQSWADKGYLPADINAIDGTAATTAFGAGKGVFFASGNWQNNTLNASLGDKVAFIPFPGAKAGSPVGLSDATEYVIPTKAKNPDAAAAFLNWVNTTDAGRKMIIDVNALIPGGPADQKVQANSPLNSQVLDAFAAIEKAEGFSPYMGNATASIFANTLTPQLQLLVADKTTPKDFVAKLQSDYQSQLGR